MNLIPKRNIYPMEDWGKYLIEGKEEFYRLFPLIINQEYRRDSFQFIRTLGKGAYGRVYLTKLQKTGHYYATKVLDKSTVVSKRLVSQVLNEKKILQSLSFPFCVYLHQAFQDNSFLYLCMPYVAGGDMFWHLRQVKKFQEDLTKFYAAQVLLALEYLHYCDMVFRDLKPENIVLDTRGYLKLTDFGFCKVLKTGNRLYTRCGTPDYLAPELVLTKGYGSSVDWWAFGILLYEMAAGCPPFQDIDVMKTFDRITSGKYAVPKFFSPELAGLIDNLLQVDLTRRYGNLKNGVLDIKNHDWLKDMDWIGLFNQKLLAPFVPVTTGEGDTSNFAKISEITMKIASVDLYENEFKDF